MTIRIYHNPHCSKSRKTLELLTAHGVRPAILPYLDEPPGASTILKLAKLLALPVRDLLRTGEEEFKTHRQDLDLDDDQALADWLQDHPRVLQRPIVVDERGGRAVIGRPPENVLALVSQ